MQPLEKTAAYVRLVCEQIRWKKARPQIAEEMKNHIIDQRDSFMAQGLDEEAATDRAIAQTGDATVIGTQLDRTHRPKPQWGMITATAALLTIGLLIRLLIFNDGNPPGQLSAGILSTVIGVVVMIAAYFSDFTLLGKYPKAVYFSVIALAIAALCFPPVIKGRAFYAQYIVLLFPLAFSAIIFATRNKGYTGLILCGLAFALPACIAIYVPSITASLLFAAAGIALLSVAIYKNWFAVKRLHGFLLMSAPILLVAVVFLLNRNGFRWSRLAIAVNPSLDPNGAGYIGTITRELLSGATLFGMGTMPEQYSVMLKQPATFFQTDLMLTTVTALLGWASFAVILGALLFFIVKGFVLCFTQKGSLGLFVSLAIMMTFTLQSISYVVFNLGFQLVSPLSLPLISYGNMATVINLGLIGFMLSVFRTGDIVKDGKTPHKNNKFFSWQDGKLTIDFKLQ